jgi:hypothetical protein
MLNVRLHYPHSNTIKNKLVKCKFNNVHIVYVGHTFHCYQHRFEFNYSYFEFVSFPMYKDPDILRAKKVVPVIKTNVMFSSSV